ncbi:MAG: cytochrome c4 [Magnetococcales bacterium]|nr:cytochrome c4 [Magnetococcales bacterium]
MALSGTADAAGASDAMLANTCAGCHGTNGVSGGPAIPSIAGMKKEILFSMMQQFKDQSRPSTIMGRIAKGYSEGELHQIAAFFEKQKWVNTTAATDAAMAAKGAKLHKSKKCKGCHEENGATQDSEENMFRMAGQWPGSLYLMMKNYQAHDYPNAPKKMIKRLKKLSDADLHALANFYASQK